ncbi:hypothetical protein M9H77_04326 [Catharanthus roseus]|uniref:Uncharacterized protein n=1 Tax=Catharanthus roseus TaxID=4058 RepID=A0ACC0CEB9_CATRO|nr:hypothetical protein M9H77_04326 [Catharanthus roseus]
MNISLLLGEDFFSFFFHYLFYSEGSRRVDCFLFLQSSSSLFRMLSTVLASGLFLFTISILGQILMPRLPSWRKYQQKDLLPQTSSIRCVQSQSLEPQKGILVKISSKEYPLDTCFSVHAKIMTSQGAKASRFFLCTTCLSQTNVKEGNFDYLKAFYFSIIRRIKDSFDWPGEIVSENDNAWIGEVPLYLRRKADFDSSSSDVSSSPTPNESFEDIKESAQDISSYQVLLSTDGKIVGFQPTSRTAVNHWASNPLAKELYGGKKLTPGLLEPGLKISYPSEVVAMELLMSVKPESRFALVRPIDTAESFNGQ